MELLLTEIKNKVGIITLNSERTLNSLNYPMADALTKVLEDWKTNDDIACVFLQGAGEKAFCAGGDVRQMHDAIIEQRQIDGTKVPQKCFDFFLKEYQLDYNIHKYPKPIVVWGSGIVMGGGMGLLVGASHRIVTEKSKLAMPEVTIGLYPDVGATYFLNRMPSAYGVYLGVTGTRLDGADALFLNLADYYMASSEKEVVIDALAAADWTKDHKATIDAILENAARKTAKPVSQAQEHQEFIKLFESAETIQQFREILLSYEAKDEWIEGGLKTFMAGSPSSTHVIFRQLNSNKNMSLADVFRSELNMSCQCSIHPDFAEGVRALLVDKDQSPKWQPATFEEVTAEWVDSYFTPLWTVDTHPLKHLV
ncbi:MULTISPECIES: enoyl-CoA hydratase/isomerase family protein [unclassified Myroides]|uniref:enoyl-CoA hydratase/isomerase family protein n=1 Tax=unclassified Myroides TaxID=2642485 RepID=UPI00310104A5